MKHPYPDLKLIKRLRGKFLEHTVKNLTNDELIDLINHQNERILDLERAASQSGVEADAESRCTCPRGSIDPCDYFDHGKCIS